MTPPVYLRIRATARVVGGLRIPPLRGLAAELGQCVLPQLGGWASRLFRRILGGERGK